jgi:hypothetical protein
MRRDCAKWLGEVEATLATIVIEVRDATGQEMTAVRVRIDGEELAPRLDGMPIEVDPGEHTFTFATEGGRVVEQRQVVHAGDRAQRVLLVIKSEAKSDSAPSDSGEAGKAGATAVPLTVESTRTPPSMPSPVPLGTYVLGGLAAAAGGVGVVLAVTGLNREGDLRSSCATRCSTADVDSLHRQYLAADILFGVAAVSATVATWLFLARGPAAASPSSPQPSTGRPALRVGVGGVGVSARF